MSAPCLNLSKPLYTMLFDHAPVAPPGAWKSKCDWAMSETPTRSTPPYFGGGLAGAGLPPGAAGATLEAPAPPAGVAGPAPGAGEQRRPIAARVAIPLPCRNLRRLDACSRKGRPGYDRPIFPSPFHGGGVNPPWVLDR